MSIKESVLDTSKVEIAPDPDFMPAKGKPIVKLIWDEKKKAWMMAVDFDVFPSLNFLASGFIQTGEYLKKQIEMQEEMKFDQQAQQTMAEAQHAAQIAASLRDSGLGSNRG